MTRKLNRQKQSLEKLLAGLQFGQDVQNYDLQTWPGQQGMQSVYVLGRKYGKQGEESACQTSKIVV